MKTLFASVVVGAVSLVLAQAQTSSPSDKKSTSDKDKGVVHISSEKATFTERFPGASMSVVWGDPDKGAHATFTKFVPGWDGGMHTHTANVWLVVIKGAYLYKDDAGEKRVGPGEFIRIPAGHKHWSGRDKTEGALFYQEGSGKIDKVDAK